MAKNKIVKKDGSATPYFWSDKDGRDPAQKAIFKETAQGVKRMVGVYYNTQTKRLVKS